MFTRFEGEGGAKHVVHLEIVDIEAYARKFTEIDEGLTARLILRGTGGQLLEDEGVLEGG